MSNKAIDNKLNEIVTYIEELKDTKNMAKKKIEKLFFKPITISRDDMDTF